MGAQERSARESRGGEAQEGGVSRPGAGSRAACGGGGGVGGDGPISGTPWGDRGGTGRGFGEAPGSAAGLAGARWEGGPRRPLRRPSPSVKGSSPRWLVAVRASGRKDRGCRPGAAVPAPSAALTPVSDTPRARDRSLLCGRLGAGAGARGPACAWLCAARLRAAPPAGGARRVCPPASQPVRAARDQAPGYFGKRLHLLSSSFTGDKTGFRAHSA